MIISYMQSAKALLTPPRSKAHKIIKTAKKDKKKQKLPKLKNLPQLEMSVELKQQPDIKRCRSLSSPMLTEEPLQGASSYAESHMPVTKEEVDGTTSPVTSDGNQQVAPKYEREHNGAPVTLREKQRSFSRGFQRSCSLDDMLSDEYESEAKWKAKVSTHKRIISFVMSFMHSLHAGSRVTASIKENSLSEIHLTPRPGEERNTTGAH